MAEGSTTHDHDAELGPDRCTSCGGSELTAVPLVLTDGTDVTFVSCLVCEQRQWLAQDDGGSWQSLPIESVLARSAKPTR